MPKFAKWELTKYLRKYKKEVVAGPVFKLTEAVFELIVPLVMANIVDIGIKQNDTDYVLSMGGVMILLSAIGLLCALICQFFAAKASQGFGTVLRNRMFSHINKLSHSELDKFGTHSLTNRMTNDINQLQLALAMFIRLAVRAPFLVIGACVMALTIDIYMGLIFVVATVVIALVIYLIMSKSVLHYKTVQKLLDGVALKTKENLQGARVIRAFCAQKNETEEFLQANEDFEKTSVRVGKISALLNPATYLILNIGIIAVLYFGGENVDLGYLEQGQVLALVQYMTQIMLALVVVANLVIIFTRAGAASQRVIEVLKTEPSVYDEKEEKPSAKAKSAVEFSNVFFSYDGSDEYVLDNINFSINAGQTLGIIGGTGAGKSTLAHLLLRFYNVSEGNIYVDGENIFSYSLQELREKIGFVPQKAELFLGSVRENLLFGDENATDEQLEKALNIAQAAGFVYSSKSGLDKKTEQKGSNLSGGQRQRLTIARALVGDPEILILDDSSSALDFATDAALREALLGMDNMTMLIISQRVNSIKNADKILVLDDGIQVGLGTHEELFETCETYREICLSQSYKEGK